ncbi:uncharacterized protein B0T23DRAFT_425105 [Neurospora hispaniola]|uniref:AA1-like domain-containing protein n=1 Tax=Neurospora hispaniola TaxID=588809 RepID=A0AAJ0IFX7_9PEZI|nr:hypothetical protein B0T23DRAFT_425105 [Neurospora hispaniola]
MQLQTVLLYALLSGLQTTLANPISEVRAPGVLHEVTKHGNKKGGHGNGGGNGHGNGHGHGNGNGDGDGDGDEWVDQGPWWSVTGFSRHWNDTTHSVELNFAIWDSRDNKEVPCIVNARIPDGQNYKFAEFHSLPCVKPDVGAEKYLISMGYVEYFDAGIMNICDTTVVDGGPSASTWFSIEAINRPRERFFPDFLRVPVGFTDLGCVYDKSPYPL